jgi:hypothetical protein
MKSIKLLLSFIVPILLLSIFNACSKEQNIRQSNTSKFMDSKTTRDLIAFKTSLHQKSTGNMDLDSAIWHIEGLLNLDNANNTHRFINLIQIKDSIVVVPENGVLTTCQIFQVYSRFQEKIDSILFNNPLFHADIADVHKTIAALKDNSETLIMDASLGEDEILTNYQPFGTTDNWLWHDQLGKCSGGWTGLDARIMLQNRFNNPVGGTPVGYFTDVVMNTAYPYESQFSDPNNPNGHGHMIFTGGSWSPCTCIPYNEMNYYLGTFDFIKADKQPTGKSFSSMTVVTDLIPGGSGGPGFYYYKLYYGIFHNGSNPE